MKTKKTIFIILSSLLIISSMALVVLKGGFLNNSKQEKTTKESISTVSKKSTEKRKDPNKPRTIVNFGDSIFGNTGVGETEDDTSITEELNKLSDDTYINCAFGNTMASTRKEYMYWDSLSLVSLVNEIVKDPTDDSKWNLQDATLSAEVFPDAFKDSVDKIKAIDFNNVDVMTIGFGTNDFTKQADMTGDDVHSYSYALDSSIKKLKEKYPNMEIVLITPIYRYWKNKDGSFLEDSDVREVNGNKLTDFVKTCETVAKENDVKVINNYDLINFETKDTYFNDNDSTHQNVLGRKLLAETLVEQLK